MMASRVHTNIKQAREYESEINKAMVAELQALTVLWQSQLSYLKARDEIRMATSRVNLISDDVRREIEETRYSLCP